MARSSSSAASRSASPMSASAPPAMQWLVASEMTKPPPPFAGAPDQLVTRHRADAAQRRDPRRGDAGQVARDVDAKAVQTFEVLIWKADQTTWWPADFNTEAAGVQVSGGGGAARL
jgi:hypothetical protein